MGNFVDALFLEQPVSPNLMFLTRCKYYTGNSSEILRLFKKYSSIQEFGSFYILYNQLKSITNDTPLHHNEDILFKFFNPTSTVKLNMMEILASIIIYSSSSWKTKVKLSFLIFDFDENKSISSDEMVIMVISFIRAIGSMTSSTVYGTLDLQPLGKLCFQMAASTLTGFIRLEDLIN